MGTPRRLVYALTMLVYACGGATANAPGRDEAATARNPGAPRRDDGCGATPAADGHALQVYLEADRGGATRPLCVGHDLTGADTLWLVVEVVSDVYVRTIFVTPDGQTGELLREDAEGLTREARFHAPRGLMTRSSGEAQFVVVASQKPLHHADPTMASMQVIRETGVLVDHEGRLTPPMHETDANPEEQLLNLGSDSLYADFDAHGVAVLTLTLQATP
jgi:hypothetical protein